MSDPLSATLSGFLKIVSKQSNKLPAPLAYGLAVIIVFVIMIFLRPVVPENILWLFTFVFISALVAFVYGDAQFRINPSFQTTTIKIVLHFPNPQHPPPSKPRDFRNAKCWYSIYSDGTKVKNDAEVTILPDLVDRERDVYLPYIYVKAPGIENPEFQFKLEYEGQEWYSDSLSLKNRSVDLQ